ncbi:lantibiotic dehydratase [Pseudoalteromonas sp. NEC-BIFX-2020_015]|uniref:lantibiotic dehydratase n=1 Tax=Pseudoalteromonas sp. NEC-BIFX-2020_015 TaxID=2729544 RepID=UPI0014616A66|nr:lantibiotic dehydratase [Pseudoalteromonas sp. NEC-BIFX-2020_015]NMR27249.1 lantibiotic dehydratase [Pseudoalteromonas sp. NEC-BIFX-2020_015]
MSNKIKCANFFVIRTPRLSVEQLDQLNDASVDNNLILEQWLAMRGVEEAIYLASPSLLERINQWREKPHTKQGKKVAHALIKYMIRMCTRPTPFGLFSGVHKGDIALNSNLTVGDYTQDYRKTRLDMFYLNALKDHFVKHASRSDTLKYKPNSSHYFIANQCRYIENYLSDKSMQYRLSAVESDEYFQFALNTAKPGVCFNDLCEAFYTKYEEAEKEDVEAYIQDLIDEGILLADIPLPLTGDSPDHALLKSIQTIKEHETADHLATALAQIEQLDNDKTGSIAPYKQLLTHLEQLPVKAEENKLFQADIYRNFSTCQLSELEVNRVQRQLELLSGLSLSEKNNPLSHFITQFNARFEGQFVPLDVILDDESGIGISSETGYEAPLVAGLNLARGSRSQNITPEVSLIDSIIEEAVSLPQNRNKVSITLKSKELKSQVTNKEAVTGYPYSFATMLSLYEDDKQQPIFKFNGCFGPSSANLLGRFCHLDDGLKNAVVEELKQEQAHSSEVIFAEVVHMPEGRPGNVIARPHLREYEIVFMADSSLDNEYQIPLSDLYVWVEGQQVKLWSKRLNKQVIPRLSCAHNYTSRSLSAYKFLCMLQHQDGRAPSFSMPSSTARASFVPRIMLDNLILSEKTWRVDRKKLEEIAVKGQFQFEKLNVLFTEYQLDYQVNYAIADNILQLDLRNPAMLDILLAETKGQIKVELKEVLTSQFTSRVKDIQGHHYTNEVIVPFKNEQAKVLSHFADNPIGNITAAPIKRRFSAGSQWLSLKIYSGNSLVEQLLSDKLQPLIEANHELYDKWFFIRYGDPDWHIRLRFHGKPNILCGQLLLKLNALLDPMIESGELHKVELMTYEREVERYGGPESMALVESLFMYDSELIAKACVLIDEYGEDVRWRIALNCTHQLLNLFNYSNEARLALVSQLRDGFGSEFNENSTLRKQLGNRFREYQNQLEEDFDKLQKIGGKRDENQQALFTLLEQWQHKVEPVVKALNVLINKKQLNCSRDSLLSSLLHMHNNRMFKAYGREQEFVIHDLLRRKYFSSANIRIK